MIINHLIATGTGLTLVATSALFLSGTAAASTTSATFLNVDDFTGGTVIAPGIIEVDLPRGSTSTAPAPIAGPNSLTPTSVTADVNLTRTPHASSSVPATPGTAVAVVGVNLGSSLTRITLLPNSYKLNGFSSALISNSSLGSHTRITANVLGTATTATVGLRPLGLGLITSGTPVEKQTVWSLFASNFAASLRALGVPVALNLNTVIKPLSLTSGPQPTIAVGLNVGGVNDGAGNGSGTGTGNGTGTGTGTATGTGATDGNRDNGDNGDNGKAAGLASTGSANLAMTGAQPLAVLATAAVLALAGSGILAAAAQRRKKVAQALRG